MKLFRNNKVYVQMNDVMFAMNHSNSIPAVIINQIFTDVVIVNNDNRMDFVNFDDKSAIDYFKKLDYIVDYDEHKDLSIEELDAKIKVLTDTLDTISTKHNNLSREKRAKNYSLVTDECEKIWYVINYLEEIKGIKLGTNHMNIPGEIIDGVTYKIEDSESTVKIDDPGKKGIKNFIKKKIFNK
jgi:hypothetical protein